jgi:hypothetical protein
MIENIPLFCGTNVGGLRHLQVVDVRNVVSIPDPINHVLESGIVLQGGIDMGVISFLPNAGDFSEKPKDSDSGQVIQKAIRVDVPKDAVEIGQWANDHAEKEVIALYMDENGVAVIVGDLERPLVMKVNKGTGRKANDMNKYEIMLEGISDHYSFYYQMFQVLPVGSRKVYSAGYTFGYQRT